MERIIWFLYNFFFVIGYFFLLPRFLLRMRRRGGYRRGFLQRFGIYSEAAKSKLAAPPGRFLIHAVSVGEIQVAMRFMAELRAKLPGSAFVLTTTTSTAHALAEKTIGGDDVLLYFPVDFPFIIRRVLRQIRPLGLILVESELWPNLVRQTSALKIPIMLLNGRISNRSFRGYRLLRPLVKRILARFTLFCAQSEEDAGRLIELGADPGRVRVTGSAKYDIADAPFRVAGQFTGNLQRLGFGAENLLLVGGSTWPGEEKALLEIFIGLRGQYPSLRLVLVPRHAERRKQVMAEITQSGLDFKLWSEVTRDFLRRQGYAGQVPRGNPPCRSSPGCADRVFTEPSEANNTIPSCDLPKSFLAKEDECRAAAQLPSPRARSEASEWAQAEGSLPLDPESRDGPKSGTVLENRPPKDVLLVDTTGELRAFYSVAAIVFIGKSLTAKGGQNPIEAAVCSKPIVVGPHMENFSGVVADFLESQAIVQVSDKEALGKTVGNLLDNKNERELLGERARQVVFKKSGALRASVNLLITAIERNKKGA